MTSLASKLKHKIRERQLSISNLEKLAGLKPSAVQNILQGKSRNPTTLTLQAICQALDCPIEELVGSKSSHMQNKNPWHGTVYLEAVKIVNDIFKDKNLDITKEKALAYIEEIYNYAITDNNHCVERRFAEWLVARDWF